MTTGIYAYWDNVNNYYVYVGRDWNIDKNERYISHKNPAKYDDQPFNRVIQNNPKRYEYRVLIEGDYNDQQLNKMEKFLIKHLKTYHYDYPNKSVFNFTKGGDGCTGYIHTNEHKQKMSKVMTGENNPNYGKYGKKNPNWKDYPRIIKGGKHKGKQRYIIRYNGKSIKSAYDIEKLKEWFKNNYLDEILRVGDDL